MTYTPMPYRPTPVRRKRWPYFLIAGIGMFLLLAFSVLIAVAPKKASVTADTQSSTSSAAVRPPVSPSTSVPPPAKPVGPATSVGTGTYKVGEDMAAGSYKATCEGRGYWSRMRSDNPHDTIANDFNANGGPMRFTTKDGEYVKISGGCTFVKVAN